MRWLDYTRRVSGAILLSLVLSSYSMYELDCEGKLLAESERIARSQIGVLESGNNRGEVAKYLRSVGLAGGNPYCAAGVYWCYDQARIKLGYSLESIPVLRTAVANAMYNDAGRRGKSVTQVVKRHDLLVWKSKRSWTGHIERVISVNDYNIVRTIGFNVKTENGEGVAVKTRFIKHPLGRLMLRGIITFRELSYDN